MSVLHYVVPGAREGEVGGGEVVMAAFPLRRRWVDTGGDCEHCGQGWRLFHCPLCPAAVCLSCAAVLPRLRLLEAVGDWWVIQKRWMRWVDTFTGRQRNAP